MRRPPRSTLDRSSAASDVYKRQEFVSNLIGEKDKGFVIEFRERPTLLAAMTSRRADLIRAIGETRAGGATAFHDSIVLGLYQFRPLAGKKALVVLTDGQDNHSSTCLLYTSDAADERSRVDLWGRRIINKKKIKQNQARRQK